MVMQKEIYAEALKKGMNAEEASIYAEAYVDAFGYGIGCGHDWFSQGGEEDQQDLATKAASEGFKSGFIEGLGM